MPKIKELSKYNGSSWETGVPIGADASNIDVNVSGGSTQDLQTVLGTPSSSTNLQAQISNKLGKSDDGKDTTVSSITNWDGSSTETSTDLVTDVVATNGDSQSTLWSKFNRFRRRVGNKFGDYFATANIQTAYQTTGTNDDVYSTSLLNSYFSNVIGYAGTSAPEAGDIITQLSSLNNNVDTLSSTISGFQKALIFRSSTSTSFSISSGSNNNMNFPVGTKYPKEQCLGVVGWDLSNGALSLSDLYYSTSNNYIHANVRNNTTAARDSTLTVFWISALK